MHGWDRTILDHLYQRSTMLLVQPRWMPAWLAIDQTSRLARVEPRHPVAHHLQRHAACLRRPGSAGAVVDHRKRHQPTDLIGVFALAGQPAQQRRNARAWRKNLNGPAVTARMLVVDDEPDVEVRFRQLFRPEVREGLYTFDFALGRGRIGLAAQALIGLRFTLQPKTLIHSKGSFW